MRIFIGIILLIISTLCGNKMSEKFILRAKFYNDFYTFNKKLKNEIQYFHNTILKIIKDTDKKSDFYNALKNYYQTNNFSFNCTYLTKEEIDYFSQYLNSIGKGDTKSQLSLINGTEDRIEEYRLTATEEESKYKKLYLKLGFLIGLIAFIIVL